MGGATLITQLIAAAITPVALISACAALILGINNKHTGIADRIRSAIAECRTETPDSARRAQLLREVRVFRHRFRLTWYALVALYAATVCLTLCVLLIVYSEQSRMTFRGGTLGLFLASVTLMLLASFLEIFEVGLSMGSMETEVADVVGPPQSRFHWLRGLFGRRPAD